MKNDLPIRCLVVDDEPLATKLLAQYINRTEGLQLVMKTTRPREALKKIQEGLVDVVFLDIQMPQLNGIELMKMIGLSCKIVLTTAYTQYALDGFEHGVADYLLKPLTYERFLVAVNKIREKHEINPKQFSEIPDFIFVKTGHRIQRLGFSSILYIEALRDYIAFHTTEGKVLSLENMKSMEAVLPESLFIRIHKSFIVNKSKINFLEKWKVVINKTYLPVGETYREKLMGNLKLDK